MVIPNPKNGLRVAEVLLSSIAELLVNVEGEFKDHGISDLAIKTADIRTVVGGLQTAVRVRLSDNQ